MQAVEDRCADDDRGAVLIIMENRNLHALAQLLLDVEALRRLDVLKVDAAEGGLQRRDHVDQLVGVRLVDFQVEHVDAGKLLEQYGLAFHHRLGSQRADVAQAQHRGAVGDDADQVAARSQRRGFGRVFDNRVAGCRHTGRISHRKILLVGQRLGGGDRNLARFGQAVVLKCGLTNLLIHACLLSCVVAVPDP